MNTKELDKLICEKTKNGENLIIYSKNNFLIGNFVMRQENHECNLIERFDMQNLNLLNYSELFTILIQGGRLLIYFDSKRNLFFAEIHYKNFDKQIVRMEEDISVESLLNRLNNSFIFEENKKAAEYILAVFGR